MTRRDFLNSLVPGRWINPTPSQTRPAAVPAPTPEAAPVAVVAGRHCLAYQGSFCSTCRERCPIDGAIVMERGLPRIDPTLCDGCGICHDLCPAPTNAILLIGRPASPPSACAPAPHTAVRLPARAPAVPPARSPSDFSSARHG